MKDIIPIKREFNTSYPSPFLLAIKNKYNFVINGPKINITTIFKMVTQYQDKLKRKHSGITARINPLIIGILQRKGFSK